MSLKLLRQILYVIKRQKKIIGLVCFFIIWWKKIRPKDHDNIPTLPNSDPMSGHILTCIKNFDIWTEMVHSTWKKQLLPISCFKTWFQFYSVLLTEPSLIKFVFETEFEKFKKGHQVQSIFDELLGHGIFMSDPPEWKFHRKVATRMFSMRNLKDYMFECGVIHSKLVISKLNNMHKNSSVIDIYDILSRYTLDCFTQIAFGKSVNSLSDNECKFGNAFDEVIYQMSFRMINPPFLWNTLRYFNILWERKIAANIKIINDFADSVLNDRQKELLNLSDEFGDKYNDILSLFMKHNKELNRKELRDIALNMIIAGRDTTRLLCSWFIYEMTLSSNSDIKKNVFKEIDEFSNKNNEIKYDDVCNKFHYLEACLLETLRIHPAVPWLIRYAVEDVKLPPFMVNGKLTEYTIRKGNQVVIPTWSYGKHPNIWKDPLKFDPMRFYDNNQIFKGVTKYSTYIYPFFNVQPRLCLGRKLAITEAKTMLFYFLKQYDFKLAPNQHIKIQSGPVLNMKYGLKIELQVR